MCVCVCVLHCSHPKALAIILVKKSLHLLFLMHRNEIDLYKFLFRILQDAFINSSNFSPDFLGLSIDNHISSDSNFSLLVCSLLCLTGALIHC